MMNQKYFQVNNQGGVEYPLGEELNVSMQQYNVLSGLVCLVSDINSTH